MARDGRWGCCSPAATPPIPPISAQCSRPSASATDDPDGLARDPIGCSRTRPTPPLPTAGSSPSAESRSPSPSARTRRPAEFDAAQLADGHAGFDAQAYQGRNVVERCFNKLKQWRGIATRFDKTARSYLAGLTLAAALIWTR